jgi:hypothetical protein
MRPEMLYKRVTVDKIRENHNCVVLVFSLRNVKCKGLAVPNKVSVQIP